MEYFETEFCNRRDSIVDIHENGRLLLRLEPGESRFVESNTPKTTYAPWSKITFKSKGEVKLEENPSWRWPFEPALMLTAINEAGTITNGLEIDGKTWDCPPGIPRYIPISLDSRWAFIERLRFIETKEKVRDGDYIKVVTKCVWVRELRSRGERKAIEKKLVKEAMLRAKAETERKFPIVEDTER